MVGTYVCTYSTYMYVCMHTCMYVCMHTYMYVGTSVHTYIYVYMCMYVHTCMYVCTEVGTGRRGVQDICGYAQSFRASVGIGHARARAQRMCRHPLCLQVRTLVVKTLVVKTLVVKTHISGNGHPEVRA